MDIKDSNDVFLTIKYSSSIGEFSKLSPKVEVKLPTFNPKPIDFFNV